MSEAPGSARSEADAKSPTFSPGMVPFLPQSLLKFILPKNRRIWLNEFRELLAREAEQAGIPEALFERRDTKHGSRPPLIQIVGASSWLGVLGTHEKGISVLQQAMPGIMTVLGKHLGGPVPVQLEGMEKVAASSPYSRIYLVREMVIRNEFEPPAPEDLPGLVRTRILRDLYRACGWQPRNNKVANVDFSDLVIDPEALEVMDVPQIEVDVISIRRPRGMRLITSEGDTGIYNTLLDAEVAVNLELKGVWLVGSLTARGHGRMIPYRPGAMQPLSIKEGP